MDKKKDNPVHCFGSRSRAANRPDESLPWNVIHVVGGRSCGDGTFQMLMFADVGTCRRLIPSWIRQSWLAAPERHGSETNLKFYANP